MSKVSTKSPGVRYPISSGYISIPQDVDREEYIKNCSSTNTVTVIFENGGWVDNVPVFKGAFNDIDWPENSDSLGSQVLLGNINMSGSTAVIAVISKRGDVTIGKEYQFIFQRNSKDGTVEMVGDAIEQFLNFTVSSSKSKKGKLNISVSNPDKSAELNINVNGIKKTDVNGSEIKKIVGEKSTTVSKKKSLSVGESIVIVVGDENPTKITITKGEGIVIQDEFSNEVEISKDGITIYSNKSIDIVSETNTISMDDSGINIDAGSNPITIGGNHEVLYSKVPFATEIVDVAQIGVSTKIKVG